MKLDYKNKKIDHIEVKGASVNNLKNINLNIPLHRLIVISGLSGSGKSSLALGVLYAEGARRYLDALSTYSRYRINQIQRANVKSVKYIPSAIALKQRPTIPGVRSTVGTVTEVYNVIRLIFSRLGVSHCPNGHAIKPSLAVSQAMDRPGKEMGLITCPVCGKKFYALAAEDFSFNGPSACPKCQGLGYIKQLDKSKVIPDKNKSINQGAVASWKLFGRHSMKTIAQKQGVRLDVPFKNLTKKEKDIVLYGKKKKHLMDITAQTGRVFHLHILYENAYQAILDSSRSAKTTRGAQRLNTFFNFLTCPVCHGSRLDPKVLKQTILGKNIVQVSGMSLEDILPFIKKVGDNLAQEMKRMFHDLFLELKTQLQPLLDLGLNYLTLNRPGNSLSSGELQRIQLGKTLRTQTTGVLYVLDEPSIGLHPDNISGLIKVFHQLLSQGNSVVVVDHQTNIISSADWVIEIGPGSGQKGGEIITQGSPTELENNPNSLIGPFLSGKARLFARKINEKINQSQFSLAINHRYNLKNISVSFPERRLISITGFSGAGKTTLILDGLFKAFQARKKQSQLPSYISTFKPGNIKQVVSVDASPVGKNVRSTLATYTNIMNEIRKIFSKTTAAKKNHYTASYFSYNNKQGACPNCRGTGNVFLDIQYLPDIKTICPVCKGKRFNPKILAIKYKNKSIADILDMDINQSLNFFKPQTKIYKTLRILKQMGLAYLHLGEDTPSLSGGEAQRLKLTSHMKTTQKHTLFIFDEPSIGLHPIDVKTLLSIFSDLIERGASIIMITHDLGLIANSDYMIDLGPKGGDLGGQVMAAGNPQKLIQRPNSLTLKYLKTYIRNFKFK